MVRRLWPLALCFSVSLAVAKSISVELLTTANKTPIGKVTFSDSKYGLLISPSLSSLGPGLHGFHLHEKPSCGHQGKDAGSHYDPQKTGKHLGPYGNGHLGDLPALFVNKAGEAKHPSLAPRLSVDDIIGKSLMVHEGGDNYADMPKPLGGGGARVACAVVGLLTLKSDAKHGGAAE